MHNCGNCEGCAFTLPRVHTGTDVTYELHITVEYDSKFDDFCKSLNLPELKVINIELGDNIPNQLMTSYAKVFKNDADCISQMKEFYKIFIEAGFKVIRSKIETSLNHSSAVDTSRHIYDNGGYFETHFVFNDPEQITDTVAFRYGFRKSRNLMKVGKNTKQLITKRFSVKSCKGSAQFIKEIELLKQILKPDKVIMEFCLKDSNENLDSLWISKY